jgi:hypothetical protein
LDLLLEAGFLKGDPMPSISRLTWEGHEFLDNIRDAGIWGKTKAKLRDLPSVAVTLIREIALAETKKHLGLP